MPDSMAPRPTVTRASLLVEYGDGRAFYLTLDEATACHVSHAADSAAAVVSDALDFRAPGGIAELTREASGDADKVLAFSFERCPGWRLVLREPGQPWPLDDRLADHG